VSRACAPLGPKKQQQPVALIIGRASNSKRHVLVLQQPSQRMRVCHAQRCNVLELLAWWSVAQKQQRALGTVAAVR
jgi:hypothetical protein